MTVPRFQDTFTVAPSPKRSLLASETRKKKEGKESSPLMAAAETSPGAAASTFLDTSKRNGVHRVAQFILRRRVTYALFTCGNGVIQFLVLSSDVLLTKEAECVGGADED